MRFVFHELSTPLNTITMSLQSLCDEKLSVEGSEFLNMAGESSDQISRTLRELLGNYLFTVF